MSNEGGIVQARIQFFALPEGVTQAALYTAVDPDDPEISACGAPKEWKVDFTLSTEKPADMELLRWWKVQPKAPRKRAITM